MPQIVVSAAKNPQHRLIIFRPKDFVAKIRTYHNVPLSSVSTED